MSHIISWFGGCRTFEQAWRKAQATGIIEVSRLRAKWDKLC